MLVVASTFLLCCSEKVSQSSVNEGDGPVTWAVDLEPSGPWWSFGQFTDDQLMKKADSLAAQFELINKGPLPVFRTIFKFEESGMSGVETSSRPRLRREIDEGLEGHPSVRWAERQRPLTRTKRVFNDPKFIAQWHLVRYTPLSTVSVNK